MMNEKVGQPGIEPKAQRIMREGELLLIQQHPTAMSNTVSHLHSKIYWFLLDFVG